MTTFTTAELFNDILNKSDPFDSPGTPSRVTQIVSQELSPSLLGASTCAYTIPSPGYATSKVIMNYSLPTPPRLLKHSGPKLQVEDSLMCLATMTAGMYLDGSPSRTANPLLHTSQARTPTPFRPRFEMVVGSRQEVFLEKIELPDVFGPTEVSRKCAALPATAPAIIGHHQKRPKLMAKMSPEAYEQAIAHIGNAMLQPFEDDSDDETSPLQLAYCKRTIDSPEHFEVDSSSPQNGKAATGTVSAPYFIRNPGVNLTPRIRSSSNAVKRNRALKTPPKSRDGARSRTLRDISAMMNVDLGNREDVWERRGRSKELKPIS